MTPLHWCQIELPTPFGPLWVAATPQGLCWSAWGRDALPALPRWASRHLPDASLAPAPADSLLAELPAALQGYLDGHPLHLPLDLRGTPFQRAVWAALLAIPYGEVTSYGALARGLGRPRAARAVGAANGANPLPPFVPCHRVVGHDQTLRGYRSGLARKAALLAHEQQGRGGAP